VAWLASFDAERCAPSIGGFDANLRCVGSLRRALRLCSFRWLSWCERDAFEDGRFSWGRLDGPIIQHRRDALDEMLVVDRVAS
jgi:hypothetical protein